MEKSEIKFILGSSPPFNKLDSARLDGLVDICEVKEYKNAETIYRQGDSPDCLYVLLAGRVSLSAEIDHKDSPIEILKRGTCFGIISLLTDDPHSVTARSIETSSVIRVTRDKFRAFLKENPLLSLDFSRLLSQRVKSRFKPKKIFQSKKIGIMGATCAGKTTYMLNLGSKLKRETRKEVICIQIISESAEAKKSLKLKDFSEETFAAYLIKGDIDRLCLQVDVGDKILALLNFLSESYHFVLYEVPPRFLETYLAEFVEPTGQLHFLIFPQKGGLKKAAGIIRDLRAKNPLNPEKIKVILAEFAGPDKLPFKQKRKFVDHPIYASLPALKLPVYSRTLSRIAREVGEVTLGLALGSGAAYGFAHIGVLKVFQEEDIPVDVICGSSMGAIIAALWAAGFSLKEITALSAQCGRKIGSFSLSGISFPFKGVMKARHLENIFKGIFKDLTFYDLKHTLKVVSFNFLKRKTVILEEGPLYKAVAASCAFPGIFAPIHVKKDLLLDGGVLNPLPTKVLLSRNVHKIIASNILLSPQQASREYSRKGNLHVFDFIFGSIETMQQQFVGEALKIADVVIHPDLEGLGWTDFTKMEEFIKRGEVACRKEIDRIRQLAVS